MAQEDIGQQGIDQHGAGDRDAVHRGQAIGRAEDEQQHQHTDHQQGIDLRYKYLPRLGFRGALDVDPRQKAELDRLLGDRKSAGDDRLRGDDRGHGGQDEDRPVGDFRHHAPERIFPRRRIGQSQGALAKIVERQAWQGEEQP